MIKAIIDFFADKKIAILGFGLEGKSTYNFIRKHLPETPIDVLDKCIKNQSEFEEDKFLSFISGDRYLDNLLDYDIIMKSPGVSFRGMDISGFEKKIYSQLELFLMYTNSFTIGVTGTKGKSTLCSLTYEMLINQNKKAKLLGNIGLPIFDQIENIDSDTIVVLEMSSHGLQYTDKSPNIAVLLNIFEEHLDHYESFEEYGDIKYNIFRFQTNDDVAIFNLENEEMIKKNYKYKDNDYGITINNYNNNDTKNTIYKKDDYIYFNGNKIYNVNDKRKLLGSHNLNDIMFVLAISNILKLDLTRTVDTINNFHPLEHRLEYVGTVNGVDYYNDSIATIPEASMESIKALECVNTIIVGGNDRGVNQENLIKFLAESNVENVLCLPKTGEYIYNGLVDTDKNVVMVNTLEEAVRTAKKVTKPGMVCVLSPAASSYGFFKNFKERGRIYKELVMDDNAC